MFFWNIKKIVEERILTINLRKYFLKYPRWRRSKRAARILREILKKRFKVETVKIGKDVTEFIWKSGAKKPPSKIRIRVFKIDEKTLEAKREV